MKHKQNVPDAWVALNVRQQRDKGSPIGGESLPNNRLGRRIMAKLHKKAVARQRMKKNDGNVKP